MRRLILTLFFPGICLAQSPAKFSDPPSWAQSAIWYEIFPERFYNGDPSNDPTLAEITVPGQSEPPPDWEVTRWTSDWYNQESWAKATGRPIKETIFYRRYGGDLQGVLMKLDYLKELGVNALYFRPLNDAPSQHKYDARAFHHIDANFGPDPAGDRKLMAEEDPQDPASWTWTSADKLFLKVVQEAHARGMKVIMDYSWNHTGILFWAFREIAEKGPAAKTKDWYMIKSFDDPSTPANEFAFDGWLGIQSLPEIKKVDLTTTRVTGWPYEGDIHPSVKKHIYDVTRRWLAPAGDVSRGIDGYRLDVADHVGLKFWREFRQVVRSINPDAYLVGEIWWQKWPEQLMDPAPYTSGDVFDAVMFYQVYRPARYFFAKTDFGINALQFKDSLEFQWSRLSMKTRYAMMNTSSSADAPRLLSDFHNPGKYKVSAKPTDNATYRTGKPDAETYQRLRLYLVHTFTSIGAPAIYYGEECGMWGADDPDDRKPMWWKEFTFDPETRNNFQPGPRQLDQVAFNQQHFDYYKKLALIRRTNPVLSNGEIRFLIAEGKKLAYARYNGKEELFVYFNLEASKQRMLLPVKGNYVDLLTGKTVAGEAIELQPLTASILRTK